MRALAIGILAGVILVFTGTNVSAQSKTDSVQAHVAAAKAAAGQEHVFLFSTLCAQPGPAAQQIPPPAASITSTSSGRRNIPPGP